MKFKNRILKFTSKSNLTIDLDFIDGRELTPKLEEDKIGRFFYSSDPAWGINSDEDWYAESSKSAMLHLVNEFDLYRNAELNTYAELIGTKQNSYEPCGLHIGSTSLYFVTHNIRNFSGFKQFLHIKSVETKNGIRTIRSTYWDLLVDLAERNILIRFPVIIRARPGEILEHKGLIIDIYIKFPTENKLKFYLKEKNIY